MIYLDHNASTPPDERVLEAMRPYLSTFYGNPSSLHRLGRISRSAIDMARCQIAALVGAEPSEVIFTSGGTEANNLAIKGLAGRFPQGTIATGATEHPSVSAPMESLRLLGFDMRILAVDAQGRLTGESLADLPKTNLRFASVMLANNETGVAQDISALAGLVREHGAYLHCDAVQATGKMPLDFRDLWSAFADAFLAQNLWPERRGRFGRRQIHHPCPPAGRWRPGTRSAQRHGKRRRNRRLRQGGGTGLGRIGIPPRPSSQSTAAIGNRVRQPCPASAYLPKTPQDCPIRSSSA